MQITPLTKLILLSSRSRLSDFEIREMNALIPQISDWEKVVSFVIGLQAGPFLYEKVSSTQAKSLIPSKVLEALRQSQLKTLSRNMVLAAHFGQVLIALNSESIAVIAMKGIYLTDWLYKNHSLRHCSDIDILIKPEDGEKALLVIEKLGYKSIQLDIPEFVRQNTEFVHFPPMIKSGVSIEVHTKIHKSTLHYRTDMDTLWQRSEIVQLHGVNVRVFCLTDQLISIAIHLEKHFDSGHFQFTGFYDIAWLLTKHESIIDWKDFQEKCEEWNTKSIYRFIYIAHKYFGAPLPDFMSEFKVDKHTIKQFEDSLFKGLFTENKTLKVESRLRNVDGVFKKAKYIFYYLFPSPSRMRRYHNLNNKWQLWYYYPYRVWSLVWVAFKYLIRKLKANN